ncbi:MAG TPA: tetratricopeptide repeat protein, partial [Candidatus Hydrogenedentes bacterium]|nr:tetratricopeptide repeat protein [Candidatus Hydrogenedentota bacterium]
MDSEEAQRKFKLAERMYNDGRYGQALLLLDSLDSEFPNAKNVMFPRARCLAKLERTAEALALCDQLIAQFDDPKAKVLKDRLTAGEGDLPPEIAAIPDIGEEVPSAIPRPIAPPQRPFFLSAPFIVGACVVIAFVGIVVAFAVWQRTTQPMEQAEELVVAEEAAPVEPGEDTRVDDIRSVVSSLGWRLLLMLVLFVVEIVAGLYLTLMVVGKLPHESFGADLLSVAPVTIGAWLA